MASLKLPPKLLPWALAALDVAPKQGATVHPVAGDASSRRYFRLQLEASSHVLVHAPPESENNQAFLQVAELLQQAGVQVPRIEAADIGQGFMLLQDLGDELLLPLLDEATAPQYYASAMDILLQEASMELPVGTLRDYDAALLREELGRFDQWFVAALLDSPLQAQEQAMLQRLYQRLIDSALQQPAVFVHRDFHSRNLMLQPDQSLAVIDFQDAVRGPVTYDLVSLLRDCYIRWPAQQVADWALGYRDRLCETGLLAPTDDVTFLRWFDWMGLQRHIKVLGTFARLYLRDGKDAYLADLPLVIEYVLEVTDKYAVQEPEFAAFGQWFRQQLAPLIARQDWSRSA